MIQTPQQMIQQVPEQTKIIGDVGAAGITVAAILKWVPEVTALLSLLYVIIRIYETKTVQDWIDKWRKKNA